jgi:2-dehydropantoate 2-reductase
MMFEAKSVNEALGIEIPLEMMDRRLAAAGSVAGYKMSMLQDLERGRSLEIDALVTAVQEIGRLTGVPTPIIDAVLALIQERSRTAKLYPQENLVETPVAGPDEEALLGWCSCLTPGAWCGRLDAGELLG